MDCGSEIKSGIRARFILPENASVGSEINTASCGQIGRYMGSAITVSTPRSAAVISSSSGVMASQGRLSDHGDRRIRTVGMQDPVIPRFLRLTQHLRQEL